MTLLHGTQKAFGPTAATTTAQEQEREHKRLSQAIADNTSESISGSKSSSVDHMSLLPTIPGCMGWNL